MKEYDVIIIGSGSGANLVNDALADLGRLGQTWGRWFSGCFHLLPVPATSVTRASARFILDVFTPR